MYVEKVGKKEQIYGQNRCIWQQKEQKNAQRSKKSEAKDIMSWFHQELNMNKQNQTSLQQKIIQLYEEIENKTIKNLQKRKNNQILQAQIEAYLAIMNKIERKKIYQQQTRQQNTYHYTFHQQNQPSDQHPDALQQTNNQQNYAEKIQTQNQSKPNIKNQLEVYCQQKITSNNRWQDKNYSQLQYNSEKHSKDKQDSKFKLSLNHQLTEFTYSKTNLHPDRKRSNHFKDLSSTGSKNFQIGSLVSISPMNGQQTLTQFKSNQQSNYKLRSPTLTNRTQNEQCERQTVYVSPRPSIDTAIPKLCSPNKSFLKKNNMSTGNLINRYSSIDIEDLWRESNPLTNNRAQKNIIPKSNAKDYINSLKGNNLKLKSKFS